MGIEFQFLDIILFALVAAFLILRLRSVLGRRDGHSGPAHDPFKPQPTPEPSDDKIIRLPDRGERVPDVAEPPLAEPVTPAPAGSLEGGLNQIRLADPSFDVNEFTSGARIAFEMILNAYAAGDTAQLKPLLSPEVFANFVQSIRDREQAGETLELTLIGIKSAEPVEAYLAGRSAHVTVKFVSEQMTVTRDENNEVIEGEPGTTTEVTDFWTFARDTRSSDPNWTLVATGTLE